MSISEKATPSLGQYKDFVLCHTFPTNFNEEKLQFIFSCPSYASFNFIIRFDGRLLLEDISTFISKRSADHDGDWQLSNDEQAIERLCDEERYRALENAEDSDDGGKFLF